MFIKAKKRGIVLGIILFSILMVFPLLTTGSEVSEKGYECLEEKIEEKSCSELSLEENIFSVLATGKCVDSLLELSKNESGEDCFGKRGACSVKKTAQASLALDEAGYDTQSYINWMRNKTKHEKELDWNIKINTDKGTNCTLENSEGSFKTTVKDFDKFEKISGDNSCFSLGENSNWIKISKDCVDKEFSAVCDNSFSLSFMFRTSDTWNVLDKTESFSSGENYTGKIDSYCFKESKRTDDCKYESTLWASLALAVKGETYSEYSSYLIGLKNRNTKYLPDSFLYYLTNDIDYSSSLFSLQHDRGYWREDRSEYYDTSVALFPFSGRENLTAKQNATSWLKEVQEEEGCWDKGDIENTAFLLYSIWPKIQTTGKNENKSNCEDEGNYCISDSACSEAGGEKINDSLCAGVNICCTEPRPKPSCNESGYFCSEDKVCQGTVLRDISDYSSEKVCCKGQCVNETEDEEDIEDEEDTDEDTTPECESYGGTCKTDCFDNQTAKNYSCISSSKKCCMTKQEDSSLFIWIIIAIIIIGLGVLGYIYRKKISVFFKEKFGKGKKPGQKGHPGRGPPGRRPPRRDPPGKMKKPSPAKAPQRASKPAPQKEKPQPQQKTKQPAQKTQKPQKKQKSKQKKKTSKKKQQKEDEEDPFKKLKSLEEKRGI